MITRRQFIQSALVGSIAVGLGAATYDIKNESYTSDFVLERVTAVIPGLPPAFNGYLIGFITDIHLGIWVPDLWLERALQEMGKAQVNLLLLGGDYILLNDNPAWQHLGVVRNQTYAAMNKAHAAAAIYESVFQLVSRLTVPDGILAVAGNHDHWNFFPSFMEIAYRYPNIKLLMNDEYEISRGEQSLLIFGADDYLTGLPTIPIARELGDGVCKRIVLAHNPDYISALLAQGSSNFSLALCGHTHGGQIVVPALGPIAAQVVDRRFVAGMHLVNGRTVYTSRGLGVVGLPFRLNCPAEVTILELRGD
jgi:predicted MPP superfamily phosphohydrolase